MGSIMQCCMAQLATVQLSQGFPLPTPEILKKMSFFTLKNKIFSQNFQFFASAAPIGTGGEYVHTILKFSIGKFIPSSNNIKIFTRAFGACYHSLWRITFRLPPPENFFWLPSYPMELQLTQHFSSTMPPTQKSWLRH